MLYACRLRENASVGVQSWLGNSEVCDPMLYAFVVQGGEHSLRLSELTTNI